MSEDTTPTWEWKGKINPEDVPVSEARARGVAWGTASGGAQLGIMLISLAAPEFILAYEFFMPTARSLPV
ncbi:hypothetical protein [Polaromonas glacialis]|uniref:hypothetical protein n=1 Tax=Polaromonas glacialis TaxID=866564 RepID=UPI0012EB9640|nr:hypothetical protein [Polaromonas glacialis]